MEAVKLVYSAYIKNISFYEFMPFPGGAIQMIRILTIAFLFMSLSAHYSMATAYNDKHKQIEVQLIAQAGEPSDSDKAQEGAQEEEPDCS